MGRKLTSMERVVLLNALGDEEHTVTCSSLGVGLWRTAVLTLYYEELLTNGPRLIGPFHDAYKLTREGLKIARRLEKEAPCPKN